MQRHHFCLNEVLYYFCNSIIVSAVNEREAQWQRTMYAALSWSTPLFPPLSFSCRF